MKKLTIHFKNGKTKKVPIEIVEQIKESLSNPSGSAIWHIFNNDKGETTLMLNLNEIAYID